MFERVDGKIVGNQDQMQLYWTELPEFGHLQSHRKSDDARQGGGGDDAHLGLLRDGLARLLDDEGQAYALLQERFLAFLSTLLGFPSASFDVAATLWAYGLDSLSAVSCQYWFHRGSFSPLSFPLFVVAMAVGAKFLCVELEIDVSVGEVLNAASIAGLVTKALEKVRTKRS